MKFRDVLVGILLEINQEKYKDFDMINSKEKVLYEDTKSTIQHIDLLGLGLIHVSLTSPGQIEIKPE